MQDEDLRKGNQGDTREEYSLDELAKGLASGTVSRSKALRVFAGLLLGGVLVSIPGVAAWARSDGGGGGAEDVARCKNQCRDNNRVCKIGCDGAWGPDGARKDSAALKRCEARCEKEYGVDTCEQGCERGTGGGLSKAVA